MSTPIISAESVSATVAQMGLNLIKNQVGGKDDAIPFLLLPLKLETRFMTVDAAGNPLQPTFGVPLFYELWVRIYPDDIAIHSHEEALTDQEIKNGRAYWAERWKAGTDEKLHLAAWRALCAGFSAPRAAWIAKATTPTNAEDVDLSVDIESRTPYIDREGIPGRDTSWSQAPVSKVMPDRFAIILMNDDEIKRIHLTKVLINPTDDSTKELQVGIDPKASSDTFSYDDEGNLIVDDKIKWMTDFDAAIDRGMGAKVSISSAEGNDGFDRLLVLGVRTSADETTCQQLIQELFDNHHYLPEGMSLLKTGTPTNNTEAGGSGYKSVDPGEESSFSVECQAPLFTFEGQKWDRADGAWLSGALGVDEGTFQHVKNSDHLGISGAICMNRSLFAGTIGHYMDDMIEAIFTGDNIDRTRNFFVENVLGRGALPSLRVGRQPYGILPTTAFSRWTIEDQEDVLNPSGSLHYNQWTSNFFDMTDAQLKKRYEVRLAQLLMLLKGEWEKKVLDDSVKTSENLASGADAQAHFLEMLGLHGSSAEHRVRYAGDIGSWKTMTDAIAGPGLISVDNYIYNPFVSDDFTSLFGDLYTKGFVALQDEELLGQSAWLAGGVRLLKLRFMDRLNQLRGPKVDEADLSELALIDPSGDASYLHWLSTNSLNDIWHNNEFSSMESRSLLFLLLRRSILMDYRATAMRILGEEDLINEINARVVGTPQMSLGDQEYSGGVHFTKWNYLFDEMDAIRNVLHGSDYFAENPTGTLYTFLKDGKYSMGDYLRTPGLPATAGTLGNHLQHIIQVGQTKTALETLQQLPTAELDRLLTEHLDLCTYRLDAWLLGLVNQRLWKQRNINHITQPRVQGLHLGAFGWLENVRKGSPRTAATDVPKDLKTSGSTIYDDGDNQGFIHAPSLNHAAAAAMLRSAYEAGKDANADVEQLAVNLSSERVRMALNLLEGVRNGQDVAALLGYQFERGLHERHAVELDVYIHKFRHRFPLEPKVQESTGESGPQTGNVVHGLNLLDQVLSVVGEEGEGSLFDRMKKDGAYSSWPYGLYDNEGLALIPSASENAAKLDAILSEIDRMANAFDALGDLSISESVYQAANGNHERAAAVLSAMGQGKNPPRPEIIDTPRSGLTVTHRVSLHIPCYSTHAAPNPWSDIPLGIRGKVAPGLNKWLADIIGEPHMIRCLVSYESGGKTMEQIVSAADLNLQPIDLLYLLGQGIESSDLKQRIAYVARSQGGIDGKGLFPDVPVHIHFQERVKWDMEYKTFYEVGPLCQHLYKLLAECRALRPEDMILPQAIDEETSIQVNLPELEARITAARTDLASILSICNPYSDPELAPETISGVAIVSLQENLLRASLFGIANLIPIPNSDDHAPLLKQVRQAFKLLNERGMQAEALLAAIPEDATDEKKLEAYESVLKTLFGKSFMLLPPFKLITTDQLQEAFEKDIFAQLLTSQPEDAMNQWLQEVAHVRPRMSDLEQVQMMTDIFEGQFPDIRPFQLPMETDARWVGLEYDPSVYQPQEDKLSLVMLNADVLGDSLASDQIGIVLDEWIEVLPQQEELTGITFNYDQPNAEAPQSILLAVTPQETNSWEWDDLVQTLNDTLDLAKIRAVEPAHFQNEFFSQLFPAVIGELPPRGIPDDATGLQMSFDFSKNNRPVPTPSDNAGQSPNQPPSSGFTPPTKGDGPINPIKDSGPSTTTFPKITDPGKDSGSSKTSTSQTTDPKKDSGTSKTSTTKTTDPKKDSTSSKSSSSSKTPPKTGSTPKFDPKKKK
ncbi:MAG: hypothetical protein AAF587_33725 [Bacteroidota bacterium]